ncbi:MAG TPA: serpin family protein [Longimicrobiaceae bacterium]|nr:serpin family protein [Longimicrobiaceae bacterium]
MRFSRILTAALLGALAACERSPSASEPMESLPRNLTAAEQEVIAASNSFAFGLLREAGPGDDGGPNVFVSPLSATMALGMTMNGARGATLDGMRAALGFGDLPLADINQAYRGYIDLLRGLDSSVQLQLANAIWAADGFPVEPSFLDTGRQFFDAEVGTLDFGLPSSVATINAWVKQQTNGKIETIVNAIPGETVMFLVNAVYFKGSWTHRFDARETRQAPFRRSDGTTETVDLMHQNVRAPFAFTPDYTAVDLPYGRGGFSMTVVVPREGGSLDALADSLDNFDWERMVDAMVETQADVYLPRFRLEYAKGLMDALEALGMEVALGRGAVPADFRGLSPLGDQLVITDVRQKTFVEVNEEGTEAAAATSVQIGPVSLPPSLRADRPFLVAIRERFSGSILFLGKIESPGRR